MKVAIASSAEYSIHLCRVAKRSKRKVSKLLDEKLKKGDEKLEKGSVFRCVSNKKSIEKLVCVSKNGRKEGQNGDVRRKAYGRERTLRETIQWKV